jgi:hypothetical protein
MIPTAKGKEDMAITDTCGDNFSRAAVFGGLFTGIYHCQQLGAVTQSDLLAHAPHFKIWLLMPLQAHTTLACRIIIPFAYRSGYGCPRRGS